MQIVPAINANIFEKLQEKVKLVELYVDWVHLDVADGTFTKNTLWYNPLDLAALDTKLNIEVHLMLNRIDKRIKDWFLPNIQRIIFHVDACANPDFVIDEIIKAGKEPGISISPDELVVKAAEYRNKIKFYQILGVHPGLSGQKTLESTYSRIKEVRGICQSCIIECDGGMNVETAKMAKEAGADIIVAANAIFTGDIKTNIELLKKAIG